MHRPSPPSVAESQSSREQNWNMLMLAWMFQQGNYSGWPNQPQTGHHQMVLWQPCCLWLESGAAPEPHPWAAFQMHHLLYPGERHGHRHRHTQHRYVCRLCQEHGDGCVILSVGLLCSRITVRYLSYLPSSSMPCHPVICDLFLVIFVSVPVLVTFL